MANSPDKAFDYNDLTAALALTGKATPTQEDMAVALELLFGDGMTVERLLTDGWMTITIDRQRLREPVLTPLEATYRPALAALAHPPEPVATQMPDGGPLHERRPGYFSYFEGGIERKKPSFEVGPLTLYRRLTSAAQRSKIEELRFAPAGASRKHIKLGLDYVTPAGIFTTRNNASLATPSGLLVLDFDHLPDVATARATLLANEVMWPELVLLFVSPSGDGLKALVRTDPTASYLDNFRAYADYLRSSGMGLVPDESGKDVSRACFVSYDPDAWLSADWQS